VGKDIQPLVFGIIPDAQAPIRLGKFLDSLLDELFQMDLVSA
jgi:hypothetical protein